MNKKTFLLTLSFGIVALLPSGLAKASSVALDVVTPSTSVSANTTISFNLTPTDFSNNPTYILTDSLAGSTLANSNISINGRFNWTTTPADIGTHNIIITAADSYGNKSSLSQTIIVRQASPLTIQSISPGSSIFANNVLSFSVAALGFSNPVFSLSDSFAGTSISNIDISPSGIVTWTPQASDVGVHNITVYVNADGGRKDSVSQSITVNGISINSLSSNNVPFGSHVSFSIASYGLSSPTFNITDFSPYNTILESDLNGNNFNWTPQAQDIGTHIITISATDSNGNVSTTKVTVQVTGAGSTTNTVTTTQTNTSTTSNSVLIGCATGELFSSVTGQPCGTSSPITPVGTSAATNSNSTFTSYLKVGSKGAEVTALQKLLTKLNFYSGPITGDFGTLTEKAVKAFQKSKGLAQLGAVGPGTRKDLNALSTSTSADATITTNSTNTTTPAVTTNKGFVFTKSLALGSTGTEVVELQKLLKADGYYSGPINGNFGTSTKAAVIKFQKAKGIAQQGNVGPSTRAELNK